MRSAFARAFIGASLAGIVTGTLIHAQPAAAAVTPGASSAATDRPGTVMDIAAGHGTLVTLPQAMADVFVADEKVADVQVRSPGQLWVFGRAPGETTVYTTNRAGAVLWSAQVRVGVNGDTIAAMLAAALPESKVAVMPLTGMVLLTGTVATPDDVAEATRLTQAFVGEKVQVLTKLRSATPQQVSLHVRIAEVNRSVSRAIGVNLASLDRSGGFLFGIGQGTAGTITANPTTGAVTSTFANTAGATTLGFAGRALGLNLLATLDLAETDGLATTLAEPNLTALSGETASFLAGGEIPIPQSQGLGAVSVEFKQYGVSLSFTPVVLSGGRISVRVRPEVSQLTDAGAVRLSGFTIPALTTRRAETTVELGSGQSFMIGGLLQNTHNSTTDKAPFLGDLPVLGALFRSNSFRKAETELVIVVTPYLVKPVDAAAIALPTDGYRAATDAARLATGRAAAATAPGTK